MLLNESHDSDTVTLKSTRCDNFPEFDTQRSERSFIEFENDSLGVANQKQHDCAMAGMQVAPFFNFKTRKLMPFLHFEFRVFGCCTSLKENLYFVIRFKLIATNVHSVYEQWPKKRKKRSNE